MNKHTQKIEGQQVIFPTDYEMFNYEKHGITCVSLQELENQGLEEGVLSLRPFLDARTHVGLHKNLKLRAIWGKGYFGEKMRLGVIPLKARAPRIVVASYHWNPRGIKQNLLDGGLSFMLEDPSLPEKIRFFKSTIPRMDGRIVFQMV